MILSVHTTGTRPETNASLELIHDCDHGCPLRSASTHLERCLEAASMLLAPFDPLRRLFRLLTAFNRDPELICLPSGQLWIALDSPAVVGAVLDCEQRLSVPVVNDF